MKRLSDLPLLLAGWVSFVLYKPLNWSIRSLLNLKAGLGRAKEAHWIGLSELIARPVGIPFLMITAPRWNCHAIMAITDPFEVDSIISLDTRILKRCAEAFSLVMYPPDGPAFSIPFDQGQNPRTEWRVRKGRYRIGARYYGPCAAPEFPEIFSDGAIAVRGRLLKDERQRYQSQLESIRNRTSWIYGLLHFYIHVFMRLGVGSPSFLKREFLPVGNPDTEFEFGAVTQGAMIQVNQAPPNEEADVYVTLYNRCSFPVDWWKAEVFPFQQQASCNGYYLVRMVQKQQTAGKLSQ